MSSSTPPPASSEPESSAGSALVDTTAVVEDLSFKQQVGDAANRWLARNRSLVLRQTPVWAQSLAALMIGLGGIALVGGIFFRIDEVVTVQGQLRSIGGTVDVKTPAGGRVSEVMFKDGETVEKGQELLRFDTRQAANQKATLTRMILLEEDQLKAQLNTLESQKNTLNGRQEVLVKRIGTKSLILTEMKVLVEQGGFQRLQFLEQQDQLFELEKQLTQIKEEKNRIQLRAEQLRLESRKSVNQMRNQLQQADLQLQYQNVTAPISGVVFDPQAIKEGVLSPGERILSIVPQKGLYAEVFVPNKDIGFVKPGQSAKVRVDAFPFTRYGELTAAVSQIGADALEPDVSQNFYRFPVKLTLKDYSLRSNEISIPLKAGMAVTTNLKLRDKRVISLLSDLLVDQTDSVRSIRQQ